MLELLQGEELIAVLNPIAWSKGTKGADCNGNTFTLLHPVI